MDFRPQTLKSRIVKVQFTYKMSHFKSDLKILDMYILKKLNSTQRQQCRNGRGGEG